jgi:deoxyribodipyrimidine photolyase
MEIQTALVLFNRDLRVNAHPALATAAKTERSVPLTTTRPRRLSRRIAAVEAT